MSPFNALAPITALLPVPRRPSQPVPAVPILPLLIAQLEQCEADTLRLLGPVYNKRLSHWRRFAGDETKLVAFVRDLLFRTSVNGWTLHQKGGLSLEAIAVGLGTPTFSQRDVDHARGTLGLAVIATKHG